MMYAIRKILGKIRDDGLNFSGEAFQSNPSQIPSEPDLEQYNLELPGIEKTWREMGTKIASFPNQMGDDNDPFQAWQRLQRNAYADGINNRGLSINESDLLIVEGALKGGK